MLSIREIQVPELDLGLNRDFDWNGSLQNRTQDQSVKSRWYAPESHCYDWTRAQEFQKSFKNASFLGFSGRSRSEKERGFRSASSVRVWGVRWTVWRGWKGLWRRVCVPCVQRTLAPATGLQAWPGEDPWRPCRRAVWWTPSSPLGERPTPPWDQPSRSRSSGLGRNGPREGWRSPRAPRLFVLLPSLAQMRGREGAALGTIGSRYGVLP
jgi:hypothetical protein